MKDIKKIEVTVEITDTGYSAFTEDMTVYTTGKDVTDLYDNLIEAVTLAKEDAASYVFQKEDFKLNLDLQQFFKYYKVLNANFLAKKIGMNPTLLSQYVRGQKKPSSKQVEKIVSGIQNIGKELAGLKLV